MPATAEQIEGTMPYIHGLVWRQFPNVPDSIADHDDLFQIAMEAVCRCAQRYDDTTGTPFVKFAGLRAYGAILDYLRQTRAGSRTHPEQEPQQLEGVHEDTFAVYDPDPADEDWTRQLYAEIDRLPAIDARRFRLHVEGEFSQVEVAEFEGVTDGAISHSLNRSRRVLKPRLSALLEEGAL